MKVKFKGGFKGMLLEHGEKAVFGLGILCFLLFAYGLLGRETLPPDKEPARLGEAVNQAKDFMEHQTWDATREGISVVDYLARAKREDVVASNFTLPVPFDQLLRELKYKRTDPQLLAVVSLRTAAGIGAFALKAEKATPVPVPVAAPAAVKPVKKKPGRPDRNGGELEPAAPEVAHERPIEGDKNKAPGGGALGLKGDSTTKKQNWVVITALVPVKKQFAEFDKVFKNAIPIQEGPPVAGANKDADKRRDIPTYRWPIIERAEIVDGSAPAKWEPVSLKGLGKFIKQWAVTAPEIVGRDYLDPAFTMPLGPLVGAFWDDSVGHEEEIPMAKTEELEHNEALANAGKVEADETAAVGNPFEIPKDAGAQPVARPAQATKPSEKKIVEYRLFRFFDFDVESGKSYRYRVRLVMNNPNYNLPDKFLKNLDSKKDEFHETPWSEASPVATVPFGKDMMIASAQPPKGSKEATIKVKLTTIDDELGLPAVMEEDVSRGTLLNYVRSVEVADHSTGKWKQRDNVNFETNAVVLDIRGGQSLSTRDRQLTAPGEALIFNGEMKLIAHNELDDLELYEANAMPSDKKPDPKVGGKKDDPNGLLNGPPKPRRKRKRRG